MNESGLLCYPIGITNSHQVGLVRDSFVAYAKEHGYSDSSALAVAAETYDGWLNDIDAFHLTKAHVYEALTSANGGAVAEGNVGGGTGMICHDFKGGIGTASRLVESPSGRYVVGVLVQVNYGDRQLLRVDGVPVGRIIGPELIPLPWSESPLAVCRREQFCQTSEVLQGNFDTNLARKYKQIGWQRCRLKLPKSFSDKLLGGSIIVIIATDAPLLPVQCRRLAQRATVGLARVVKSTGLLTWLN